VSELLQASRAQLDRNSRQLKVIVLWLVHPRLLHMLACALEFF
jgi:hypothetical protein